MHSLKKVWQLFDRKERIHFGLFLCAVLTSSCLEILGIGLILPFILAILQPEKLHAIIANHVFFHPFLSWSQHQIIMLTAVVLLFVFISKNMFLCWLQWVIARFVFKTSAELGDRLFKVYLFQPYAFFLQHSSITLFRNVSSEVNTFAGAYLVPLFQIITNGVILLGIFIFLLCLDPLGMLIISVSLTVAMLLFLWVIRNKTRYYGRVRQGAWARLNEYVVQAASSVKEMKILAKEKFFYRAFIQQNDQLAHSDAHQQFLTVAPKYIAETIAVIVVLVIMLAMLFLHNSPMHIFIALSVLGVSALKILPSLNLMVSAMSRLRYGEPALEVIHRDLMLSMPKKQPVSHFKDLDVHKIVFKKQLEIKHLSFAYADQKQPQLHDVSLKIKKGEMVAFVGESGAGKTTLVDLLLGLLTPREGVIEIDGVPIEQGLSSWRSHLGYVPQHTYLLDGSIRENIAFGVAPEDICDQRVWECLKSAHLREFVESLPEQLHNKVGEHGVRISGGQRQRIAIARALYHDPEVLVFDEATSALDVKTEAAISENIQEISKGRTIILIAHRLSTVERCNRIFYLREGRVRAFGTYHELVQNSVAFKNFVTGSNH